MKCVARDTNRQYDLWGFTSSSEPKQDGSDYHVEHFGSPHLARAIGSFLAFHLLPLLMTHLPQHLLRQEDRLALKQRSVPYIHTLNNVLSRRLLTVQICGPFNQRHGFVISVTTSKESRARIRLFHSIDQ